MKILNQDFTAHKISGKDWFTIIIDKEQKEIFALTNLSCNTAECEYLSKKFNIAEHWIDTRFYFVFSGNNIDAELIPKKYRKFTILND